MAGQSNAFCIDYFLCPNISWVYTEQPQRHMSVAEQSSAFHIGYFQHLPIALVHDEPLLEPSSMAEQSNVLHSDCLPCLTTAWFLA